ncbi:MAG: TetR/AcrR family transcriptional regulator, partial [Gemmatimonadota bacterium]|nr:TetR/AcrR family transcriptional regulator [Gemmatimonadota bacterium]
MDEIAGESELSKGTLYLYFKNKEELLMAINERGLGILARMLEEALEKGLTGRKMLRKTGEAYLEFAMKHNDYFRAMMYHEGQIVPEQLDSDVVESCVEKGNQCISCMIRAIQAGKMDGSIKIAIDSYQLAMLLWATLY